MKRGHKVFFYATSVYQDDTLTYTVFCFGYFQLFLLLAYVSPGATNFVLVSHFYHNFLSTSVLCLGCQFLAHSVFMPYILFIFHALQSDSLSSKMFCMYFEVTEIECSFKGT